MWWSTLFTEHVERNIRYTVTCVMILIWWLYWSLVNAVSAAAAEFGLLESKPMSNRLYLLSAVPQIDKDNRFTSTTMSRVGKYGCTEAACRSARFAQPKSPLAATVERINGSEICGMDSDKSLSAWSVRFHCGTTTCSHVLNRVVYVAVTGVSYKHDWQVVYLLSATRIRNISIQRSGGW